MSAQTKPKTSTTNGLNAERYLALTGGPDTTDELIEHFKGACNETVGVHRRVTRFLGPPMLPGTQRYLFDVLITGLEYADGSGLRFNWKGELRWSYGYPMAIHDTPRVHGSFDVEKGEGTIRLGDPPR